MLYLGFPGCTIASFYKALGTKVDTTVSKGTIAFQCSMWQKQIVKGVKGEERWK